MTSKYEFLQEVKILIEADTSAAAAEKAIVRISKDLGSGRKLPKGFVPLKELEKLIRLEDKFDDAQERESEDATVFYQTGVRAAETLTRRRKGEIIHLENGRTKNEDSIRFLISIVGERVSHQEAAKTIQKYLVPLLGDPEFVAFGKPKFLSSEPTTDDNMFPVEAITFDVELPIL